MCGIVGAIAQRNITPVLIEGLKRLILLFRLADQVELGERGVEHRHLNKLWGIDSGISALKGKNQHWCPWGLQVCAILLFFAGDYLMRLSGEGMDVSHSGVWL